MKYPEHTISKPITGKQAKRVIQAIDSGGSIASPAYLAMIDRIMTKREKKSVGTGPDKIQKL